MLSAPPSLRLLLIRIGFLAILDIFAVQLTLVLGTRVSPVLGFLIGGFTIFVNIVFLDDRLYPWRWISPALAGMVLLVVYPIGYSLVTAFFNYGDGHMLNKEQVIAQFEGDYYSPANATTYQATVYQSPAGKFRFWLTAPDGKTYIGSPDDAALKVIAADDASVGERDAKGIPKALGDYARIGVQTVAQQLQNVTIPDPPNQIRLTRIQLLTQTFEAKAQLRRHTYDPVKDTMTDNESGKVYRNERGTFTLGEGDTKEILNPGFAAFIGLDNLLRVVADQNVRDPFWRVFGWTLLFSGGSVLSTFALGLGFAMILNDKDLPLRPLWRSFLIIPYAVPGYLTAVVWKGLLNPNYGPINNLLLSLTGVSPNWWADPGLAKFAILFINLYLGFPYMMLICLGALQSIPQDMFEAAMIDGASSRQRFQFVLLPMLLVAVGPLLVASFAYNFNNFTLIEIVNAGGPPISAGTVAGHTDILISYTYRLAFSGARGADYGFAAAISIFIFLIVGTLTFVNFRFTRQLEEVNG